MKIIFFGLGSIGLRHAALLQKMGNHELSAFRTFKGQRQNELGVPEVTSWGEVDKVQPDIAFITNPTSLHIETAILCARRGMHLFIEKPLGNDLKNLPRLLKIVREKKLATYVAYVLRFHPAIREIQKYIGQYQFLHMRVKTTSFLHRWRPGTDPLKSYSARKKMGGGVIFELSHELDYVEYLLGKIRTIKGQSGRRSRVTVDAEDYSDMVITTKKGPVNVHVNFLSQIEQRKIQIDFKELSIEGDLIRNKIYEFRDGKCVKKYQLEGTTRDCYEPQIKYFLDHLKRPRMMNNVFEAEKLFRKIYFFEKNGVYHDQYSCHCLRPRWL